MELFGGTEKFELMAVIALGYPARKSGKGNRKGLVEKIFFRK